MNIIKTSKDTIEDKRKHVGYLISGIVYDTISKIEDAAKEENNNGLLSQNVREIKTKYDTRGEKTTFIASHHVSYEVSQKVRRNSLIEFLIDKLSEDELNQLNALVSITDVSITDEA